MNNVHVFHHNDTDGKAAGYIVYKYTSNPKIAIPRENIHFHSINYGMDFPFGKIDKGDVVIIVDYSIAPNEMVKLMDITKNVIWIDHHITAIKKYEKDYINKGETIPGIRHVGKCGALLTWYYFIIHDNSDISKYDGDVTKCFRYSCEGTAKRVDIPKGKIPEWLALVNDHDLWKLELLPNTDYFQTYMCSETHNPTSLLWYDIDHSLAKLHRVIKEGHQMVTFRNGLYQEQRKEIGFYAELEGYRCFCVNSPLANHHMFDRMDDIGDIQILFSYDGETWRWSLYSDTVDVSEIAAKFGGGGHKGASGCRTNKFILKKLDE